MEQPPEQTLSIKIKSIRKKKWMEKAKSSRSNKAITNKDYKIEEELPALVMVMEEVVHRQKQSRPWKRES